MAERLKRHPLSAIWGDMPEGEYAELVESVRREGILDYVIKTLDDQVLDGWHRYRAAHDAGVPRQLLIAEYTGNDPAGFVIRKNAQRRHLTTSQRVQMIVGCREMAKTGRPKKGDNLSSFPTVAEMAEEAGASERTVQRAKSIEEAGLGDDVRSGEMPASVAVERAKGDPDKPKEPTRTERLEAERDAARMDVQEKAEENERLERALREARAQMSEYPHEREKAATEREAIISTLRSQLNEYMVRANEDSQSLRYWKREAKQPCRNCGTEWEFTDD